MENPGGGGTFMITAGGSYVPSRAKPRPGLQPPGLQQPGPPPATRPHSSANTRACWQRAGLLLHGCVAGLARPHATRAKPKPNPNPSPSGNTPHLAPGGNSPVPPPPSLSSRPPASTSCPAA